MALSSTAIIGPFVMDDAKFYFCFRQSFPQPPGAWVLQGPYDTYDQAKDARQRAKAWDADVGIPFSASCKTEAQEKCDNWI